MRGSRTTLAILPVKRVPAAREAPYLIKAATNYSLFYGLSIDGIVHRMARISCIPARLSVIVPMNEYNEYIEKVSFIACIGTIEVTADNDIRAAAHLCCGRRT